MVEAAAREKTERIINAEILKAASNPELQPGSSSLSNGGVTEEMVGGGEMEVKCEEEREGEARLFEALPSPPATDSSAAEEMMSDTDAGPNTGTFLIDF